MGFIVNRIERELGIDLNGDGYIGGEGFLSKLERYTRIDFNGDNVIGRPPDVYYGYGYPYGRYTGFTPAPVPAYASFGPVYRSLVPHRFAMF